jgi:Cu(I)/Ag(I) efflux system membrane protein CusA/SilA
VATAIGGTNVARTVEGLERYPINLRYTRDVRDSLTRLEALPIVTPAGAQITLGDVAKVEIRDGPGMIKSENARPNGWTYVDIEGRDIGSYVE